MQLNIFHSFEAVIANENDEKYLWKLYISNI